MTTSKRGAATRRYQARKLARVYDERDLDEVKMPSGSLVYRRCRHQEERERERRKELCRGRGKAAGLWYVG